MARTFDSSISNVLTRASNLGITAVPLTIAAWVRTTSTSGDRLIGCIGINGGGTTHQFGLYMPSGSRVIRAAVANGGGSDFAVTSAAATDSTWAHACGVFASDTSRAAYLNGGSKGTDTANRVPATSIDTVGVGVGVISTGLAGAWVGDIAEVAFWNVALTDDEVASLAKGVSPLLVRPTSLVAYWPILGNDSPEQDRWKNKYDLTVSGSLPKASHPRIIRPVGAAA